jgi:hypothetical protein
VAEEGIRSRRQQGGYQMHLEENIAVANDEHPAMQGQQMAALDPARDFPLR